MSLNKFSKNVTQDPSQPAAQAMLHAIGLKKNDLKKNMKDWSSAAVEKAEEVSKIAVAKTEELTKISKIYSSNRIKFQIT
mgnify:CR=1 FL=1